MLTICSYSPSPNHSRANRLRMPLFGAARISHAMAPRKGGVTNEAVTRARISRRSGRSVRATSQVSGRAAAAAPSATLAAISSAVRYGLAKLGSVASRTKLAAVNAPLLSVTLYQTSHPRGSRTRPHRNSASRTMTGRDRSIERMARLPARGSATVIAITRSSARSLSRALLRHGARVRPQPAGNGREDGRRSAYLDHRVTRSSLQPEVFGVFLLDLRRFLLLGLRVGLHRLDLGERLHAGRQRHVGMHRAHPRHVDQQLLSLLREQVIGEYARGIRMRRVDDDAGTPRDGRRAFRRIDKTERCAFLDHLQRQVFAAIRRDRAFALYHLLRRVGGRLHLHYLLLSELLQIIPAEIAADLIGHRHDRAAIAGMRLDDLAFPFRVEQIGETFRRVLGLDELRVVLDRRQREPVGRVKPIRIAIVGRVFRDIGRDVGSEPALFLPGEQRRHIGTFDDVGGADIAAALLRDALHDALAAVSFDLHVDAG